MLTAAVTVAVLSLAGAAAADDPNAKPARAAAKASAATDAPTDQSELKPAVEPAADAAINPLPEDLRAGHLLIYAGGGFAFMPSALVPTASPTLDVGLGGAAQLTLGVGLNRFLVLGLDGSFSYAGLGGDSCDSCSLMSIGGGLGVAFHPSQAFAFDPWIRYAVGYRYSSASFSALAPSGGPSDASESAIDFAKISIGGDFYPDPLFGFGPYLETDLGVNRLDASAHVYANVQLGLRLAFDPMRAGVKVSPGALSAANR